MDAAVLHPAIASVRNVAPPEVHWSKRPRPYVKVAKPTDLDWDPVAEPLYISVGGAQVRAGTSFAICRPGVERWPLGIVSDQYQITSHRASAAAVVSYCSNLVRPNGIIIAGHGYHVAHGYYIQHLHAAEIAGAPITTKLIISNDHTGVGAMRSSMVVYVGNSALGSIISTRALHVGEQPARWYSEIESMTERAILAQDAQDALLELLRAASARIMTDADRKFFDRRRMLVQKKAVTALDAVRTWHEGTNLVSTWGVWARRLDDTAIVALCALLGPAYGAALDAVLGGVRYGKAIS